MARTVPLKLREADLVPSLPQAVATGAPEPETASGVPEVAVEPRQPGQPVRELARVVVELRELAPARVE